MKLTLKIEQDTDPIDPRKHYDHQSKMVCFHRRYQLGDDHDIQSGQFDGWEELAKHLHTENEILVILPLFLYDHSGITMSTGQGYPFNCPWDAGMVGFIYVTREGVKEWGLDPKNLDQITKNLEGEVQEYDQFLTGDAWGFIIEDENGEHIDSCWGFFGYEYAEEEGKGILESCQATEDKRVQEEEDSERAEALERFLAAVLHDSPYDPAVIARCKPAGYL